MIAWHGKQEVKDTAVATVRHHRETDTLVKGVYWENGRGCGVGCLIKSSNHAEYEPRFGIPQALARLEDTIFENLPNGDAMKWPERFLKAAKPGADLSLVQWQFLDFVLTEALSRKDAGSVREACQPALEVVRAKARGEVVSASVAWSAAESAAESVVWSVESVARSVARSVESVVWSVARSAESVTRSAAWSVALSVESAAESVAWSAAWSAERAAWSVVWKRYASKLIELMKAAPVPEGVV